MTPISRPHHQPLSPPKPLEAASAPRSPESKTNANRFRSPSSTSLPVPARTLRHSIFNADLVRRFEDFWRGGPGGDPWPDTSPLRSLWDGAWPEIRESGETWSEGISEFFFGTEEVAAPEPEIPSVDEVLTYHRSFEKLEAGPERDRLWRETIARLRAEGFSSFPRDIDSYEVFRERLAALGSRLPDRIVSLPNALRLLRNHELLGESCATLPVAVVIGPSSDYNNAFSSFQGYPLLDSLIDSGRFHVLYFENSEEAGAREALRAAREGVGRRIHTVVLAGHGLPTALALGGPDPGETGTMGPEEDFIDIGDLRDGELGDLDELIEPEGQVLMWSCSNGAGGDGALNMANAVAESAPDRRVYSSPIPTNIERLAVREDLSLEVSWRDTEGYVASHHAGDPSVLRPEVNETQNMTRIAASHRRSNNASH